MECIQDSVLENELLKILTLGLVANKQVGVFSEVRFTRGGDFCFLLEERDWKRDFLMIFCGKIFWIYNRDTDDI